MSLDTEKNIQVIVFDNFDELASMQKEWDDFVESEGGDIFLTYDWCRVWWKYYGGNKIVRIFIFRCKDKLVGILPTYIDKIGIGLISVKIARIVGTPFTPTEIKPSVLDEYMRLVLGQWLERLFSEFRPDIVCIGPIEGTYDKTDRLVDECASWGGQRFVAEKRKTDAVTVFRLGSTVEEYLASLSRKVIRDIERCSRNISKVLPDKDARLVYEPVSALDLHGAFGDFIRMHNLQWQSLGCSGHFNDWPLSEVFHKEAAESQLKRGRLRFFKVCIGHSCIGYEYVYKFSRTYLHYLNTRTIAKKFDLISVGKISFYELVKRAALEGVNLIYSMRGRYEYKLRMGGVLLPTHVVLIFRDGLHANLKVHILRYISRLLNFCYYKIWFLKVAPKLHFRRRPLWNIWIRTNVFVN